MRRLLPGLAVILLGIAGAPLPAQQEEKPLPISREALLGKWEGKSGKTTVRLNFTAKGVGGEVEERLANGGRGIGFKDDYDIDPKANGVRIGSLGEGRLVQGGGLRLTLGSPQLNLPRGTVITLSRPMRRD
jgi:hypothetical protein